MEQLSVWEAIGRHKRPNCVTGRKSVDSKAETIRRNIWPVGRYLLGANPCLGCSFLVKADDEGGGRDQLGSVKNPTLQDLTMESCEPDLNMQIGLVRPRKTCRCWGGPGAFSALGEETWK